MLCICAKRNNAALALLVITLALPLGAKLEIAGAAFFPSRILIYICFFKIIARRELASIQYNKVDYTIIALYSITTLFLLIRGDESILMIFAKLMDALFGYFSFRALIRSPEEFTRLLKAFCLFLIPYTIVVLYERITHQNVFSLIADHRSGWLRDDKIRCFGSFGHPSLLGSLGATLFPLFIAQAWNNRKTLWPIIGCILSVAIVGSSNSGGPLSALIVGCVGWSVWCLRRHMRLFRLILASGLVVIVLVMKAPIWYLPTKISSITGGSGWHRSYLMEVSFRHLSEWWALGIAVKETSSWMPYSLPSSGGVDVTNQYLAFGFSGGLLAMGLFIFLIYRVFSSLGVALQRVRNTGSIHSERILWGLGVALAVHTINWLAISYFDQFELIWMFQIASMSTIAAFWTDSRVNNAPTNATQASHTSGKC